MGFARRLAKSPLFLCSCAAAAVMGGTMYYRETSSCGYKADRKLEDVTAVVTGASSGIGLATSKKLAEAGARVIMACRNMDKCRDERRKIILSTRNKRVVCQQCDLSSLNSVLEFAKRLKKDDEKVNLLINNAGVMYVPPLPTENGFEPHLGVNFLGPYLLTVLLLEKLKQSSPSRIVNVVDMSCKRSQLNFHDLNCSRKYDKSKAYDQSQLARVVATRHLARFLTDSGVVINDIFPGYTETELGQQLNTKFMSAITWPARKMGLQPPEKAANAVIQLAVAPEFGQTSGKTFRYDRKAQTLTEADVNEQAEDKSVQFRLGLTADYWTHAKEAMQTLQQVVVEKSK